MKFKIAVVGHHDAIRGFSLLGAVPFPASSAKEAAQILLTIKRETQNETTKKPDERGNSFAIVFVTEDLASGLSVEDERKLASGPLPAIIPIPSHKGSTGYSTARLSRIVERAIGSDILK